MAKLAGETGGFSGAGLEDLVNEAKLRAVERISGEKLENNSVQTPWMILTMSFIILRRSLKSLRIGKSK
ncbi:hypothetical protein [Wolbachia pipientis]|uniref:hypothetical protein n=1 Tax=Wolbachia pipientis TaxID=955 RepID=UPI003364F1C1